MFEKIEYDIGWMNECDKILLFITRKCPEGITAMEISYLFQMKYSNIHNKLKRLITNGYLKKIEGKESDGNNKVKILYVATKKAKKRVNYLMAKHFDNWIPIPL